MSEPEPDIWATVPSSGYHPAYPSTSTSPWHEFDPLHPPTPRPPSRPPTTLLGTGTRRESKLVLIDNSDDDDDDDRDDHDVPHTTRPDASTSPPPLPPQPQEGGFTLSNMLRSIKNAASSPVASTSASPSRTPPPLDRPTPHTSSAPPPPAMSPRPHPATSRPSTPTTSRVTATPTPNSASSPLPKPFASIASVFRSNPPAATASTAPHGPSTKGKLSEGDASQQGQFDDEKKPANQPRWIPSKQPRPPGPDDEKSDGWTTTTREPTPGKRRTRKTVAERESRPDPQFDFNRFLEQMRTRSADPIAKYLRSFLKEFSRKPPQSPSDQTRVVNDFLDFISLKMRETDPWRGIYVDEVKRGERIAKELEEEEEEEDDRGGETQRVDDEPLGETREDRSRAGEKRRDRTRDDRADSHSSLTNGKDDEADDDVLRLEEQAARRDVGLYGVERAEAEFDLTMEAMEKLVMNRLWHLTFTPALDLSLFPAGMSPSGDTERDAVVRQRIRLFGWIEPKHLDLPIESRAEGTTDGDEREEDGTARSDTSSVEDGPGPVERETDGEETRDGAGRDAIVDAKRDPTSSDAPPPHASPEDSPNSGARDDLAQEAKPSEPVTAVTSATVTTSTLGPTVDFSSNPAEPAPAESSSSPASSGPSTDETDREGLAPQGQSRDRERAGPPTRNAPGGGEGGGGGQRQRPDPQGFVEFACAELRKMNQFKAPRDKLICVLNCCKVIFGLIRHVASPEEGADTFIPFLIYVVLRANPDHLVSNLQYIQRFRNPEKLAGEGGYYLSSL
ncbi:hypothetical protein JCM10212_002416, partial [Sporobolomyces blumeae]